MTTPPDELFSLARLRATVDWPQLADAVWALRSPLPVEGLLARCGGAVATDMRWNVYYDPAEIAPFTPGQAATALVHEAWHCLRRHGERVLAAGIEPQWRGAAQAATDAEIDGDMERCTPKPQWPYEVFTPADLSMPAGLPWEEYYPTARRVVGPKPHRCSGGSSMDGVPRDWERSDGVGAGGAERAAVRASVARAVAAGRAGSVPEGWRRWAAETLAPLRVPWQRLLGAALRGGLMAASGAVDYSWQVPSRRQAVTPVLLPVLRRPTPSVGIVVDTSGSMGAAELARVLAEVEGIIRATGAAVRVYACDDKVRGGAQQVQHANAIHLFGGGGTDMRAGIAFAEQQRPGDDVLVILTDGRSSWARAKPRGMCVIVGLVGSAHAKPSTVPRWARVVEVAA